MVQVDEEVSAGGGDNLILAIDPQYLSDLKDAK